MVHDRVNSVRGIGEGVHDRVNSVRGIGEGVRKTSLTSTPFIEMPVPRKKSISFYDLTIAF